MAYIPCLACGENHSRLMQKEIIRALMAFQEGDGHLVTSDGIKPRCILDALEMPNTEKVKYLNENGRANLGIETILSSMQRKNAAVTRGAA